MNFLAKVIANADEAEITDLKRKVSEMVSNIQSLDLEIKEYLENNYGKLNPLLRDNHISIKAQSLSAEMEQLHIRVTTQTKRELDGSANQLKEITATLQETNLCLNVVEKLLNIHKTIKSAEDDQDHKYYLNASIKLKSVQDMLSQNSGHIEKLNVYRPLVAAVSSLNNRFLKESSDVWKSYIVWNECSKQDGKINLSELIIDNKKSEIIQALHYYDCYLDCELKLLSNKILKQLLLRIIDYQSSFQAKHEDGISTLKIEFHLKDEKPNCSQAISVLTQVCLFLSENLDVFMNENEIFFNKIGELIEKEFSEYFISNCISEAIPTRQEEFSQFSVVIEDVVNFDNLLKEKGLLHQSNDLILKYVKNADSLFASKTCQTYLVQAIKIFKRDLHVTIPVESRINVIEFETPLKSENTNLEESDLGLCKNSFQFPECEISKSTEDLLSLIRDILNETSKCTNFCSGELFYTARNIVRLYCDLMPMIHANLLQSIPQQSALFYNNCMYLAHKLAILGVEYSLLLNENIATFVDYVEPLRMLGQTTLNAQVDTQRKQLMNVLKESGLSTLNESNLQLQQTIEKSFRQCLRQLSLLHNVWQNTLAISAYCRAIGSLCNTLLEVVIDNVVSMEGISIDMAIQLTNICQLFLDQIPNLFPDSHEVNRHVKRWPKFTELIKVLNSSLKDIDDRWADGKGPLAQEFPVEHIKHLIRALFQNTNHRATLLSRLK